MNDPGEQAKSLIGHAIAAAVRHVHDLRLNRPGAMCETSSGRAEQFVVSLRRALLMRQVGLGEAMAKKLIADLCSRTYWVDAGVLASWTSACERGTVSRGWFRRVVEQATADCPPPAPSVGGPGIEFSGLASIVERASAVLVDIEKINAGSDRVVRDLVQALS